MFEIDRLSSYRIIYLTHRSSSFCISDCYVGVRFLIDMRWMCHNTRWRWFDGICHGSSYCGRRIVQVSVGVWQCNWRFCVRLLQNFDYLRKFEYASLSCTRNVTKKARETLFHRVRCIRSISFRARYALYIRIILMSHTIRNAIFYSFIKSYYTMKLEKYRPLKIKR